MDSSASGLSQQQASRRLDEVGVNALSSHGARPLEVLTRQLRNPLLILLVAAAVTSFAVGEHLSALIILGIIAMSVGLGFFNEYRSELAVQALHSKLHHTALVKRDGKFMALDVTRIVPGDVVQLAVGDVVAADMRLLQADGLECDEGVLTGESLPAEKSSELIQTAPASSLALSSCALMGTVVRAGSGLGVVVSTGARTAFGAIAVKLGERQPETAFQMGLRDFSKMLVGVTGVLACSILIINVVLGRSLLGSILFALAIAVGLTPQLLPAIVTVSLSTGAKRLAEKSVVVKRLVSIEDLGNIMVLFTDKTGTLTEGTITFAAALDATGQPSQAVLRAGLLCNDATFSDGRVIGGNQLDQALWQAPGANKADIEHARRLAELPFDYQRRLEAVLVDEADSERQIIVKGAPETVIARCTNTPPQAQAVLDGQFAAGSRVVAVATRAAGDRTSLSADDERDLDLAGFLTFVDRPKANVGQALDKLKKLEVELKLITGDNERVAQKVCADIGVTVAGTLTGAQLDQLDDPKLEAALPNTTIFARVTPEQKSRIIKAQRALGSTVGFLGDGVNDAVALHDADVGISVDSATDVAKDAADIVLLNKDLGVLAGGIVEGRRIFSNTMKYILMGTSSNFGNMFSAAGASLILSFLPMLPSQILLNNLLYDTSEMNDPDRQRRRRAARASGALGHRLHPPLHDALRPDQLDLRLRHLWRHDLGVPRPRAAVPIGLVRRVALHPEPRHLRHPYPPQPLLPQQAKQAPDHLHAPLRGDRRRPALLSVRSRARLHRAATQLPGHRDGDDHRLSRSRRTRQAVLLPGSPQGRAARPAGSRTGETDPSSRHALEHPRAPASRGRPASHLTRASKARDPARCATDRIARYGSP